jgi:hypothetical protein
LAIHVLRAVFAAVVGGVCCLQPASRHDNGSAATDSAVLLGMVIVFAVVRNIMHRGDRAGRMSTQDGVR